MKETRVSNNNYLEQGRTLKQQGKYAEAIALLDRGIALAGKTGSAAESWETLFQLKKELGESLLRSGENDAALEQYLDIVNTVNASEAASRPLPELHDDMVRISIDLMHIYYAKKMFAEASGVLSQCIAHYVPEDNTFLRNKLLNKMDVIAPPNSAPQ